MPSIPSTITSSKRCHYTQPHAQYPSTHISSAHIHSKPQANMPKFDGNFSTPCDMTGQTRISGTTELHRSILFRFLHQSTTASPTLGLTSKHPPILSSTTPQHPPSLQSIPLTVLLLASHMTSHHPSTPRSSVPQLIRTVPPVTAPILHTPRNK
ncbi:hypothetical protein BT63DRAFT_456410 [Microthyrium microscopicum]|uniref:Uncharacterized protein n=1 Tax=Microthyrium microscopicum TaxID=703497 RepID=A0A6A6U939_9PEZI|nr:hypothetical protein BT63DRAFT_456410 [Microthyrium microscopicum]